MGAMDAKLILIIWIRSDRNLALLRTLRPQGRRCIIIELHMFPLIVFSVIVVSRTLDTFIVRLLNLSMLKSSDIEVIGFRNICH